DGLRRDLLAFPVKAAGEADFVEHFRSRIAHKVKDPVLLAYARRKHRVFPHFTLLFITLSRLFASPCGPRYPLRRQWAPLLALGAGYCEQKRAPESMLRSRKRMRLPVANGRDRPPRAKFDMKFRFSAGPMAGSGH